ncbi:hypothetical protein [Companilactobacillus sp. HBUAS59544]|uniref:hypothetical protein n=1 Tax=Companilactobacillus sp. HBUAS59544 TaxID=3109363 RepID=UPI002FF42CE7
MKFTQSSECKVLYNYPESILKGTVEVLGHFELFQQWNEDNISQFLVILRNASEFGDNPEADGALLTVYNAVKAYFNYLVTENELNMSREDLQYLLENFEEDNGLYVFPKFSSLEEESKEWSWQVAYEIDQTIDKWINGYIKASKHPERIEQAEIFDYMRNLSKQIYDRNRLTPNNWNREAIETTIVINGTQLPMKKDYYLARNKEVASLLGYVVGQHWMKGNQAAIINQSLKASVETASKVLRYFDEPGPEENYANKFRNFTITDESFVLRLLYEVDKFAGMDEDMNDLLLF